MELKIHLD